MNNGCSPSVHAIAEPECEDRTVTSRTERGELRRHLGIAVEPPARSSGRICMSPLIGNANAVKFVADRPNFRGGTCRGERWGRSHLESRHPSPPNDQVQRPAERVHCGRTW